ncbi:EAL domain, c-di-GMP-specific phosphodiesterase class I (or its enzymatically inactive variant) [Parafrankia irregularis]|uniref:EAL domain, c-di-GMP-specific phosphodiesterase class I (Or its enzymatically inactive variant) n=1 Tax=Parafrankia irregularis TaxID=795642 RepID=A0A0S4QYV8_9ACTN|nr:MULTISPECIES: EAL domain-containing protein [Parafrankia]MBE3206794.1 EAL domain-containing protein [Parafrankia sp. CH37]CUU60816.1 EAL domain, c-di-GMP-specific phosphodiesterase class I (or its enzymatically inactive variant) [Parafrankia irregularis]
MATKTFGPPTEAVLAPDQKVLDLLDVLRRHLDMDAVSLSIWEGDLAVTQVVSGDGASFGLAPGVTVTRGRQLSREIQDARIPLVIGDARSEPQTAKSNIIKDLDIGAYAVTDLSDAQGEPYGLRACVAHRPRPGLAPREGRFLGLIASFLQEFLIDLRRLWETRSGVWRCISRLIDTGGPRIVYQPIVRMATGQVTGVEALSRFPADCFGRTRDTEGWYADARAVDLYSELETIAIRRALAALPDLPPGVKLAVNASPSTVAHGLLPLTLDLPDPSRLIVEVTEHERWADTPDAIEAVRLLRGTGVHIAVDDAGTGYSGLEQLIALRPDIIKLDHTITRGIDRDPVRAALAAGLVVLAGKIHAKVIAEGIETVEEHDAVLAAGIELGQGYLLGRPGPLATACATSRDQTS